jgi:hypothetical protein
MTNENNKQNLIEESNSMQNNNSKKQSRFVKTKFAKVLFCGVVCVGAGLILSEVTLATAKFDIDAGVTGGATPLISAVKAHWTKPVLITTAAAALIGEGDGKQRITRALCGLGASGVFMLGLLAALS